MRKFLSYIIFSLFLLPFLSGQNWRSEASLLQARGEFANVIVGDKLYIMGGIFNSRSGPAEVEVYDFQTESWSVVSTLPLHKNHFTIGASVYGDEIWLCGGKLDGGGRRGSAQVDVYNTRSNSWRRGPDLPETHWGGPSVIIGNKLHVLTGAIGNGSTSDRHFVLDLDNESAGWTTAAKVPEPRVHVAGVAYKGKIWLIGGEYTHSHSGDTKTVQVYDPETDSWDLSYPELPEARSHAEWATFVHNDKIYSVSGVDIANNPQVGQSCIFTYSSRSNLWEQIFDLPERLASPGARIYQDRLYVMGGGIRSWFGGDMLAMQSHPIEDDFTLPVEWGKFELFRREDGIELKWNSLRETANKGFGIERSSHAQAGFIELAFEASQGDSEVEQQYTYLDQNPNIGINYYRLSQEDMDGSVSYSPSLAIEYSRVGEFSLFPNPTQDKLTLKQDFTQDGFWEIRNTLGQRVKFGIVENSKQEISIRGLDNGVYILSLYKLEGDDVSRASFIKFTP
ncbi:MAG: kelch repeat-containing protein [Bacteroidota bacterium]